MEGIGCYYILGVGIAEFMEGEDNALVQLPKDLGSGKSILVSFIVRSYRYGSEELKDESSRWNKIIPQCCPLYSVGLFSF